MTLVIERTEKKKLILTRIIFISAFVLVAELFRREINDYAFFFAFIFSFLLLISITELKIYSDSIFIKKHYLCGVIPVTFQIFKDSNAKVSPVDLSIDSDTNAYLFTDSFFSFLPIFMTPSVSFKIYRIRYTDKKGRAKKFDCRLSEKEFTLINHILNA